jgi:phenylacetate-CoA ligase
MTPVRQKVTSVLYSVTRPSVLKYLNELNQLQWLSADEQTALQHKWLEQVLEYANTYVPYYRGLFKEIGFHPSDFAANPACFQELPLLTKNLIRQNYDRLITLEPARQNSLIRAKTGGTTGEPMRFMQDQIYDNYRAAHIFHQMEWSGWQLGQPQGWLWGHVLTGASSKEESVIVKLKDWMVGRFRSNAFHLSPDNMEKFAIQLEKHPGSVVWSYVSTMYRFAQFVQGRGQPIKLHAVYTAAEPLYDHHRRFIETVFGCQVFNSYSSVEIGHIACECDRHNGLHILTRNCYLEVLRDGQPVPDGEEGEFVLTNLTNWAFPLIRYKIEDGGKKRVQPCPCGRGQPMLEAVEGRIIDFFKTRDRGRVWGAFVIPMVPALGKIKQYQIVQKSLDLIVFLIIMKEGPIDESKFAEIQKACKIALGENVEVKFEFVDNLPTTPTGKHRYVISEVE